MQNVFHLTGNIVRWTLISARSGSDFWVYLSSRNTARLKLLCDSPCLCAYCTLVSTVEWAGWHSGEQSCLLAFLGQVEQFGWGGISVVPRERWTCLSEGTSQSNYHHGQRKGCEVPRAGIQPRERRLASGLAEKETSPEAPEFAAAQEPNEGWLGGQPPCRKGPNLLGCDD